MWMQVIVFKKENITVSCLMDKIDNKKYLSYKWTYLQNRNRVTDVENKLMVTGGSEEGGINWKIGIDTYTLLYIK